MKYSNFLQNMETYTNFAKLLLPIFLQAIYSESPDHVLMCGFETSFDIHSLE